MAERKEDLRVIRTRKLLYSTLINLLQKESIENLSVVGICKAAMVHRTTFYAYFEDKYHLLACLVEDIKRTELAKLKNIEKDLSLKELCRKSAMIILDYIAEHENVIRKIFKHNNNENVMNLVKKSLENSIKEIVIAEKNKKGYKLPVYIITAYFTGGIYNVAYYWLSNPEMEHITRSQWIKYLDIILNEDIYAEIDEIVK